MDKEAHGKVAPQRRRHKWNQRQIKMNICRIIKTVTTDQAGETDADACSPTHTREKMEVLPEAHGRSSEQHEPPENLRKESYGER